MIFTRYKCGLCGETTVQKQGLPEVWHNCPKAKGEHLMAPLPGDLDSKGRSVEP